MQNKIYIFILFSILNFSCNNKEENLNEITFWGFGSEGELIKPLVQDFENENKNVKVNVQQIPWTAAHEKLLTAFVGNTTPDVCQLGNTWIPEFVALGSLEKIDKYLINSEIKKSNYFDGIYKTNIIDSSLYGIPWYVDTRVIFYRKDLFEKVGFTEPPKTWNELKIICEKLKKLNPNQYPLFLPTNEWGPQILFGMQNKSLFLKENNTLANFSDQTFSEAIDFYQYFFKNNYSPIGMSKITNLYQAFTEGYIMIYISGPWNIGEFKKRIPTEKQNIWMTTPMPTNDSIYPGVSLAGGSSLVMFKNSKKKKLVWKFIEFLSKKENQIKFYKASGNLPANVIAWDDTIFSKNIYTSAFRKQFDRIIPTPKVPEWEQIVTKVQDYGEFFANDKNSQKINLLSKLDSEVNKILEKRRKILNKNEN